MYKYNCIYVDKCIHICVYTYRCVLYYLYVYVYVYTCMSAKKQSATPSDPAVLNLSCLSMCFQSRRTQA